MLTTARRKHFGQCSSPFWFEVDCSPHSVWVIETYNDLQYIILHHTHIWVWVNTYRYIFSGMNIHLPAILMFTRGTRFWPIPIYIIYIIECSTQCRDACHCISQKILCQMGDFDHVIFSKSTSDDPNCHTYFSGGSSTVYALSCTSSIRNLPSFFRYRWWTPPTQ